MGALVRRILDGSGPRDVPMKRRVAASAAGLGGAGIFAALALQMRTDVFDLSGPTLVLSGLLAASAIGMTRKSLVAQIGARTLGWMVFVPAALATLFRTLDGRFDAATVGIAATTGAALFLSRPMLSCREAYERFAPTSFRNFFLAGAMALTSLASIFALFTWETASHGHHWFAALVSGLVTTALASSVVGVLRMRAWGVLLAVATSIAMIASVPFTNGALLLAAIPGLLMGLPVVAAARSRAKGERVRVASDIEPIAEPARVRIATDDHEAELAELEPVAAPAARAARLSI